MASLSCLLFGWLVGNTAAGPNLSVRMVVAGPHHRAAIFKDLHIIDERTFAQFLPLLRPRIYQAAKISPLPCRKWSYHDEAKSKVPGRFLLRPSQPANHPGSCPRWEYQAVRQDSHCQKRRSSDNPDCVRRQRTCCPGTCSSSGRNSAESPFELAPIDLATGAESDEARPRPMSRSMD